MSFTAHLSFMFKNYYRSHRYIREIVLILIFHIFFWGFLYGNKPDEAIWTVFSVLSIMLAMVTVPSLFYLEKGNSLYFSIIRLRGRRNFFFSKIALIFFIDFFWVCLFTILYGLRFLDTDYFLMLPVRLSFIGFLLLLSISILSLTFTYKPWITLILMILLIFGGILNKSALFPMASISDFYIWFTFLLPPILEIIYSAVTLDFTVWRTTFLIIAFLQLLTFLWLNNKLMMKKDLV